MSAPPAIRPFRFAVQKMGFEDPAEVTSFARRVEALGYDELYSYDHFGADDPFAPLMVAALATELLRVGPLVINNEFHHPALLARTAASVDRLIGGRLVLGLGTGYDQAEHASIGLTLRQPKARVDRFGESLSVLRSLLDDGTCQFDGDHHRLAVTEVESRASQPHVPFLIGGHGHRVVALGARYADIFQFTGLTHGEGGKPEPGGFAIEQVIERSRQLTAAAGDRDDQIERSTLVQLATVGPDARSSDEAGRLADRARAAGLDADTIDGTPFVLIGSVDQIVDKLERLRQLIGISHVVVRDPDAFAPIVDQLAGR
jgi:probable F420-dependent oxidoreductase